jgi:DNA-binding XRE family transcriptional regulator
MMSENGTGRIARLIEKTREERKLSACQLAIELGISRQTLYDWKKEKYIPRTATLGKISSKGGWKEIFARDLSLILLQ